MDNLKRLAENFRIAIDKAKNEGEFKNDLIFYDFPSGCCGDASDLLAEFLLRKGIQTTYVGGTFYYNNEECDLQSHAWLFTKDHTIIDITGDQFKYDSALLNYDIPVYVGEEDDFHKLFEEEDRDIHIHDGISALGDGCQYRLWKLYQKILKYI